MLPGTGEPSHQAPSTAWAESSVPRWGAGRGCWGGFSLACNLPQPERVQVPVPCRYPCRSVCPYPHVFHSAILELPSHRVTTGPSSSHQLEIQLPTQLREQLYLNKFSKTAQTKATEHTAFLLSCTWLSQGLCCWGCRKPLGIHSWKCPQQSDFRFPCI